MAEPDDSPVACIVTESASPQASTYGWLCQNPLTSSCGTTICSLYEGSKNYNRVTKFALGTVESAVTFAAGTARPVVGKVVEKLDRPSKFARLSNCLGFLVSFLCQSFHLLQSTRKLTINVSRSHSDTLSVVTAVDGVVAGQLVKLGDKYPVLTQEPAVVRIRNNYHPYHSGRTLCIVLC